MTRWAASTLRPRGLHRPLRLVGWCLGLCLFAGPAVSVAVGDEPSDDGTLYDQAFDEGYCAGYDDGYNGYPFNESLPTGDSEYELAYADGYLLGYDDGAYYAIWEDYYDDHPDGDYDDEYDDYYDDYYDDWPDGTYDGDDDEGGGE